MNKVGIVSGIGPASTIEYYSGIINNFKKKFGLASNPEIVIDSLNMFDFDSALELDDYYKVSEILLNSISNLAKAGADFAAIACNTAHIVLNKIADKSDIPIISILDVTCQHILDNGYKKVVILASGTTLRNRMYESILSKIGIMAITPNIQDIDTIAKIIYPNLENGIVLDDDKEKMISIAEKYIKANDADAVLLGCTEIPLMIKDHDLSTNIINTTNLHINAIGNAIEDIN